MEIQFPFSTLFLYEKWNTNVENNEITKENIQHEYEIYHKLKYLNINL